MAAIAIGALGAVLVSVLAVVQSLAVPTPGQGVPYPIDSFIVSDDGRTLTLRAWASGQDRLVGAEVLSERPDQVRVQMLVELGEGEWRDSHEISADVQLSEPLGDRPVVDQNGTLLYAEFTSTPVEGNPGEPRESPGAGEEPVRVRPTVKPSFEGVEG